MYQVVKTSFFKTSAKNIASYIISDSGNKQVARDFLKQLFDFADSTFSVFPAIGQEVIREGVIYRKVPFPKNKNYYYIIRINEASKTVFVVNIYHSARSDENTIDKL